MSVVSMKHKPGSATVSIVRNPYGADVKRSRTIPVGSIRIDVDPDDVKHVFKPSPKNSRKTPGSTALTDDDCTIIKAWLIKHGDSQAAARREARDKRVERAILERTRTGNGDDLNDFTGAVKALRRVGLEIQNIAIDEKAAGRDPWNLLRPRYIEIHKEYKEFLLKASKAGVTKKRGGAK